MNVILPPEVLQMIPADWRGLSPDQIASKLVNHIQMEERKIKLSGYKPWPKQLEFHAKGLTHRQRLFRAINQCNARSSVIETAAGERRISELIASGGFDVRSWDGESQCVARASPVFLVGIEPAFRVHLGSGEVFECSRRHRVLTIEGWLSLDQLVLRGDALHYLDAGRGLMASCGTGSHQDGLALLGRQGIGLGPLPLPDGARRRNHFFSIEDAEERIQAHSRACPTSDRRPTFDDEKSRLSDLCASFEGPADQSDAALSPDDIQAIARSVDGLNPAQAKNGVCLRQFLSVQVHADSLILFPSGLPKLIGLQNILAIEEVGYQPILDFQVKGTHSYVTRGVVHHNCGKTWGACAETAFHLTGDYPQWWPGRRFSTATRGWVVSESMVFSRDNSQKLLLGETPEEWGTGLIPAAKIKKIIRASHAATDAVDTVRVHHANGGTSTLLFKSAEVERNKLGGDTLDFAHCDEEPPAGHYEEVLTRTNVKAGSVYTTFTPLKGATPLYKQLTEGNPAAIADICWTINDESHYTPERKLELIEQYKNSPQRDARLYAKPQRGFGTVFQEINEDDIKVKSIQVPDHWYRIAGIDFGMADPTVLIWLAHDREQNFWYLYDAYGRANALPSTHYTAWKSRGENIPVAWPIDGYKRGSNDGIQLKANYTEMGMKMLPEPAMLPKVDEKGMPIGQRTSVSAQLDVLIELMVQGRFKVAAHLDGWWKEFREYYRKENGELNDANNHFIDATRYAVTMERRGFGVSAASARRLQLSTSRYSSRYS